MPPKSAQGRLCFASEGSSRLGVLSGGPPFSLFVMLLKQPKGVWELDVPFVVCPLRWFFRLLGHESFHFVPCIPPFFWVLWFIYDWQGFHHHFIWVCKRWIDGRPWEMCMMIVYVVGLALGHYNVGRCIWIVHVG